MPPASCAFVQKPLSWVTLTDLQAWADHLGQGSLKPASQNRALTAVKSLLSFAQETGYLPFNVGAAVKLRPNRDGLAQRILEESEVARLIEAAPEGRNRVLLKLLYVSGVRVSEICGLKWCDALARQEGGQITVFGKGGKTRTVLLKPKVWQQLLSIQGRSQGGRSRSFASRKGGGALDVSQVRRIVYAAAQKGRPGTEGLTPLDAPRPRQPRARPQRPDSPGAGHARACLGFDYRPLSARPADRKLQLLPAGLREPPPGSLSIASGGGVPFGFEKAQCLSGTVLNGPWPLGGCGPIAGLRCAEQNGGSRRMAEMAQRSSARMPPPADIAIRFGPKQNLDDGADHGFALGPGSRIERRLEILAIGMFRQEPVGDNAIDESAIVGRIDQFVGRQHPDQVRQKRAKSSGPSIAAPHRIGSLCRPVLRPPYVQKR